MEGWIKKMPDGHRGVNESENTPQSWYNSPFGYLAGAGILAIGVGGIFGGMGGCSELPWNVDRAYQFEALKYQAGIEKARLETEAAKYNAEASQAQLERTRILFQSPKLKGMLDESTPIPSGPIPDNPFKDSTSIPPSSLPDPGLVPDPIPLPKYEESNPAPKYKP